MPSISVPTAIVGAGVLGAGASVASGLIGADAATSAAQTQADAAQQAQQTQLAMFNASQRLEAPYNTIGTGAMNMLANIYGIPYGTKPGSALAPGQTPANSNAPPAGGGIPGIALPANVNANAYSPGGQAVQNQAFNAFSKSPDYQFAFQQGLQALQRSAAAQGNLISGGQLKGAQEFGQGLASQQFGNYFNRLLSLGQIGQSAASGSATNALASGQQIGNTQQALGQAIASGQVGSANALGGALQGVAGAGTGAVNNLLTSQLYSRLGSPSSYNALGGAGPVPLA